jgi:hypothetical protein
MVVLHHSNLIRYELIRSISTSPMITLETFDLLRHIFEFAILSLHLSQKKKTLLLNDSISKILFNYFNFFIGSNFLGNNYISFIGKMPLSFTFVTFRSYYLSS